METIVAIIAISLLVMDAALILIMMTLKEMTDFFEGGTSLLYEISNARFEILNLIRLKNYVLSEQQGNIIYRKSKNKKFDNFFGEDGIDI